MPPRWSSTLFDGRGVLAFPAADGAGDAGHG